MRILRWGLALAALGGFMAFAGLWLFQSYGIYHFHTRAERPEDFGLTGTRIAGFTSEDGITIHVWIHDPAPGRPVLLGLLGNGSTPGPTLRRLAPLGAQGYGLAVMEYRGSGGTPGTPGEAAFAADARAFYDNLDRLMGQAIPPARRVLHGFSLGTGVAARLAAERPVAALILEGSYDRMCRYTELSFHVSLCPVMWRERYDAIDWIPRVSAPKLFVHGGRDRVMPIAWAQELFAAAPEPKRFVTLEGGGHLNLDRFGLVPTITGFLAANGL